MRPKISIEMDRIGKNVEKWIGVERRWKVRLNLHSGLHPGAKEFSLLRSKSPICETAGWIAIL